MQLQRAPFNNICTEIHMIYESLYRQGQHETKAHISLTSSYIKRAEDT